MSSKYDLEAIEADYRAGQMSNRAIANKHGCSESYVRKQATLHGWQKDLSDKVKAATKAKIAKNTATDAAKAQGKEALTDDEIIEYASEGAVGIISSHIALARKYREIVTEYGNILYDQVKARAITVQAKDGSVVEIDLPLDYVGKALTSSTQSLERLIKIERQAFNIDEEQGKSKGKSLDELLAEVAPDDLQEE